MLKTTLKISFILLMAFCFPAVNAQQCGDINGDTEIDISDLTSFLDYFYNDGYIEMQNADIDGRIGVTISDFNLFVDFCFDKNISYFCEPTEIYNYALSDTDTLYLSYYNDIPENKNKLFFPVGFTGTINSHASYFPILTNQTTNFQYETANSWDEYLYTSIGSSPDTVVIYSIQGCPLPFYSLTGNNVLASFKYSRTNNGPDNISHEVTDRTDTLKYGVGKSGDMFRPTVVNVDISYPFGDYNLDKELTISDLTGLVNWLFLGDIRYEPYEQAFGVSNIDNNCDGIFSISDLVYFVDFLFGSGPEPCNPFAF